MIRVNPVDLMAPVKTFAQPIDAAMFLDDAIADGAVKSWTADTEAEHLAVEWMVFPSRLDRLAALWVDPQPTLMDAVPQGWDRIEGDG